jgi:hypothetical protein
MMDKIKSKYPQFIMTRRVRLLNYYPMMKTILTTYSTGDEMPFSIEGSETKKEKDYLDLLEKIITLELKELNDFIQENS